MANLIKSYTSKIETLQDGVTEDAEKILGKIDVRKLMKDPETYLKALSREFYKSQKGRVREAIKTGEKHGERILGQS